ncbi:MAG: histidinol-phosphatase [Spirochaetaceae bacterium]|nr:histidinol-phosphatase [Spirochaetaceae bacterium]
MRLSSLHTHSDFCDGQDSLEQLCSAASTQGLSAIGFSSHAPLLRKTGLQSDWHIPEDKLDDYLQTIDRLRSQWAGKLQVFAGLEIDYIKGLMGPADFCGAALDYRIGSVHYLVPPQGNPFAVDGSPSDFERGLYEGFSGDCKALVNAYWDSLEDMIHAGGFDIVGHVDLIKKNNRRHQYFSPDSAWYGERMERFAALLAGSSFIVEVNTGGLSRGRTDELYPSVPLLRLLQHAGVPVMVTADAHCAGQLTSFYDEAYRTLLALGWTSTVFFEGRKNGKALWGKEDISWGN